MFLLDPGSEFFHPGSKVKKISDPDPHIRNEVFLTPRPVSKLSEKLSGTDPDFFSHSRIPDQHFPNTENILIVMINFQKVP
jgi:hypothetical protein